MIIQNIPSSFLTIIENSNCVFSDDSRFIYASHPNENFVISIYDNKYNKYVTLKADTTITKYFNQIKDFKGFNSCIGQPYLHVINENVLVILFDHDSFAYQDNGYSALLMLVRTNFSTKTFSMTDKLLYKHCYYPFLLKDGLQYALLHISEIDTLMDDGNECRCFLLEIDETQIRQIRNDPLLFDYNYLSLQYLPFKVHFHDNKIWFFRDFEPVGIRRFGQPTIPSEPMEQLSYFDLNDPIPIKEKTVEILKQNGESFYTCGFLFYFPNQHEIEMLNLHTKTWSNGKNNALLQKYNFYDKLISFTTQRSKHGPYNIDQQFNVTAVDKTSKELICVPIPQKLYDIAWTIALNCGFLNQEESKLPKKLKYEKLF